MMTMTKNEFEQKWNALPRNQGEEIFQMVDSDHPLSFYFRQNALGNKEMLLISAYEPQNIKGSKLLLIEIGKRKDMQWATRFKLLRREEEAVFVHLCWDLVESSRDKTDDKKGMAFVFERFIKWQRLMQLGGSGLLSESEIKGLIGELLFLESFILSGHDKRIAVDGWQGAEKTDRDFAFNNCWYEIKATNPGAVSVRISSIEQLDTDEAGQLIVYFLEKTSSTENSAFTLKKLVDRLRTIISDDAAVLSMFESKLLNAHYIDLKEYDETYYVLRGQACYQVDDHFPRVRRSMLSNAVIKLSYDLSLSNLSEWETTN
jgi:hypothetical protein